MIKFKDSISLMMIWAAIYFPYYWSILQQPIETTTEQLPTLIFGVFVSYIIISIAIISLKTS